MGSSCPSQVYLTATSCTFSDIHNLWDFHNPVRSLLNDRLMHIRMIILLIMRVGGMGVWSILVLLRLLIHLLVHHRCPLHIVETVQCLHLIAHMDNKPPQVVPRAITARLHTMINHLGDMVPLGMMIEWETVDMDRVSPYVATHPRRSESPRPTPGPEYKYRRATKDYLRSMDHRPLLPVKNLRRNGRSGQGRKSPRIINCRCLDLYL